MFWFDIEYSTLLHFCKVVLRIFRYFGEWLKRRNIHKNYPAGYQVFTKSSHMRSLIRTFFRMCRQGHILCKIHSHRVLIVFFTIDMIRRHMQTFFAFRAKEKGGQKASCNCTCKPGSVLTCVNRDHLSLPCVTAELGAYAPAAIGTSAESRGAPRCAAQRRCFG